MFSCAIRRACEYFRINRYKAWLRFMNATRWGIGLRMTALACAGVMLAGTVAPAIKNMAVVAPAGSKLQDVPLAELAKLCKGAQKTWADGRNFTLVMRDPELPELRVAVQKLFGVPPGEVKSAIAKLNETRAVVRIVESDVELLRTVEATPGAVGILDVYAINSTVKVLRIDGKLPFDVGYPLKGN
jgi:hypothetical protein